jgi:exosortase E/protease (VPEID-CTERM system)
VRNDTVPGNAAHRFIWLGALLTLELVAVSVWLDTESLDRQTGLLGLIGDWGPEGLLTLVASVAIALTLAYATSRGTFERRFEELSTPPVRWGVMVMHVVALGVWIRLSRSLFAATPSGQSTNLAAAVWLALGAAVVVLAALAFVPPRSWLKLAGATRTVWMYAATAALASVLLKGSADALWKPSSDLTFALVRTSLHPFVPDLLADPVAFRIKSHAFSVVIAKECSGLEGAGLMLVFGALWLWLQRHEYRFPRALLLIPIGVVVMWLTNILRLDILFLIGHGGLRNVAAGGFHSQAGWIAFNAVAIVFSVASRRARWLTKDGVEPPLADSYENPVTPYLVPLLAILAAGMVSRAVSGRFEWLYPLRFVVAAAVLWHFRSRYRDLDWRAGWLAPVAGIVVFGVWLALDRLVTIPDDGIVAGLASLPAPARLFWILFRTLGAVVTVPIAEELAFRGYLMRRLASSDFGSLSFTRVNLFAVLASSAVFGVLHGDRVVAGSIAGVIYASTSMWRGRIGDAVVAHATTNALIAAAVLLGGMWQLW